MKRFFLSLCILFSICNAFGQQQEQLKVSLGVIFNNRPIILSDSFYNDQRGNDIKFETIKFYISKLQLLQSDSIVFAEQNSFHLVDLADTNSTHFLLRLNEKIKFNKIKFNFGLDSLTNVSGALGGDLDPTKGMYWTWQSGFINFKMEGACKISQSQLKNFEFHLGGYRYPFNPIQCIELELHDNSNLNIDLDLDKFFSEIDLQKQKNIMSPSLEAVLLFKKISTYFSIR